MQLCSDIACLKPFRHMMTKPLWLGLGLSARRWNEWPNKNGVQTEIETNGLNEPDPHEVMMLPRRDMDNERYCSVIGFYLTSTHGPDFP